MLLREEDVVRGLSLPAGSENNEPIGMSDKRYQTIMGSCSLRRKHSMALDRDLIKAVIEVIAPWATILAIALALIFKDHLPGMFQRIVPPPRRDHRRRSKNPGR